ncbi:ArdC family protein [Peribacillus frigoritolerans]|uniref:ArdC family protein n=2 Tax=Peribacillus frigoritolerans TaxID=450367 RepID=UPI00207A0112|nr:zincin-like metallopeptidase domain-containing protein [Peribacillus frigoritolerans]USK77801.1 ssDNA-binding domain-containing protein [Peribacillus frigoritolerans]
MGVNVYEMVTDKIIEKLEQGVVPWRKPWVNGGAAVNWKTETAYRGINTMLLEPGEYATFKQIKEAGGKVKKGEQSHLVVFWKMLDGEDKNTGKETKIPLLRYYRVFEINTQVEGLQSKRNLEETFEHDPIEAAENIVKGYINSPSLSWERVGAWYKPGQDHVNVPPMKDFPEIEKYYSTLFHELTHSTGHKSRLNREGITSATAHFGSESYSKEELVAEMGASMLTAMAGFGDTTLEHSTAYIQSWLRALKNDKTMVVKAGSQAQKAVDLILGTKFE